MTCQPMINLAQMQKVLILFPPSFILFSFLHPILKSQRGIPKPALLTFPSMMGLRTSKWTFFWTIHMNILCTPAAFLFSFLYITPLSFVSMELKTMYTIICRKDFTFIFWTAVLSLWRAERERARVLSAFHLPILETLRAELKSRMWHGPEVRGDRVVFSLESLKGERYSLGLL